MRRRALLSVSMAAVMAVASVDIPGLASAAQARSNRSAPSKVFKPSFKPAFKPRVNVNPRMQGLQKKFVKTPLVVNKAPFKYVPKYVAKGSVNSPFAQQIQVRRTLPLFKPSLAAGPLKARLGLPQNLQPKVTLVKAPKMALTPKFAPFVQRHWKKAFFWVAVAGIGYLTVPEYYYDRFIAYVDEDDPNYDAALGLLSLAALDDDDNIVRMPRPASTPYRYSATVAPPKPVISGPETIDPSAKSAGEAVTACTLKPFVDRKWSQAFVWVQVPEVGDVTVPEDSYDKFVGLISGDPPNYNSACNVLAEAAAADTISVAVTNSPT